MATANDNVNFVQGLAKTEIKRVNLSEIWFNTDDNVRKEYGKDEMEELKASIRAVGGILQPVQVVEIDDAEETKHKLYALVAGFRRILALSELAEEDPQYGENIPAIILVQAENQIALDISQLIENVQRVDLNAIEASDGITKLLENTEYNLRPRDVAHMLGISEQKVSHLRKLQELDKDIREAVRKGEISFSAARVLAYTVPKDKQADAAKMAKHMNYGDFERKMNMLYRQQETDTKDGQPASEAGGDGTQKKPNLVRANKLSSVYLPFVAQKAKEAQSDTDKLIWEARLDALKWVMQEAGTQLGEVTATLDAELEQKAEEEKKNKEATSARHEFVKKCVKQIRDKHDAMPEEGQVRPTLAACMASVLQDVDSRVKAGENLGFEVGEWDKFVEEVKAEWEAEKKAREENAKKRKEAAEKKRLEKEAAEAAAKASEGAPKTAK